MIENKHVKYAPFESNFLSVTFDKQRGSIAFLGIESGGINDGWMWKQYRRERQRILP